MEKQDDKSLYIEEQREWLMRWREQTGTSWAKVAKLTGVVQGTISQFATRAGYYGKKQSSEYPIAQKVERYRHSLAQQVEISDQVPDVPEFFRTETGDALERMLGFAQNGMIVAGALEAGCGKTTIAKHYATVYSNAFHVELCKSAAGMNNMLQAVLEVLGINQAPSGSYAMSRLVRAHLRKLDKPLLIIDEAQHLSGDSLEEIRHWHDKCDVGIAFFGNVGILQKLAKYAQLISRIQLPIQIRVPSPADIEALADAWYITDGKMRRELQGICGKLGGLRNGTNALRLARMMAKSEDKAIDLEHLRLAWAELSMRPVAA